ncbi:ANTAR domain-containing protein [Amycolatopsis regifaucium]|uniref:ANTAR domain-containing protein n=1 Tax=Amycolatopsis regifaucium TaxID=546365 RepID=UPI000781E225|nr:ANTAR domain-containing protein [Amycolatopsis regifaucium]
MTKRVVHDRRWLLGFATLAACAALQITALAGHHRRPDRGAGLAGDRRSQRPHDLSAAGSYGHHGHRDEHPRGRCSRPARARVTACCRYWFATSRTPSRPTEQVHQATGFLAVKLDITPAEALVRIHAHALGHGRALIDRARDILTHHLRLDDHHR